MRPKMAAGTIVSRSYSEMRPSPTTISIAIPYSNSYSRTRRHTSAKSNGASKYCRRIGMSRSRMSISISHEPRFRMRSSAAWTTAARSAVLWALLVLVLHAVAASQNGATSSPHSGIKNREAAGCLTDCTPRFGIVSAFGNEAELLVAKTVDRREYRINGNVFTTGVLEANPVVIVLTGQSIENASMLTQLLIDHFRVHHLLLSGIAGGLSDANHIGDVVVPDKWSL